jgi:hypothetical protein
MIKRFTKYNHAVLMILLLTTIFSCKKEDNTHAVPPSITGVTDLTNRGTALSSVKYGEWIVIKGAHLATTYKVEFNTVLVADSLYYADDSTVTVKIPANLPDPINNPITVTTKYGSATYGFKIMQPAPIITGFNPEAGISGDQVTISGNHFNGVSEVKFGNTVATIVSKSNQQLKVNVPAGITSAFITVTTPVGMATSPIRFGFKYVIYDEKLQTGWSNTSYSSTAVLNHTTTVKRGTTAISNAYTVGFGGFRLSKAAPAVSLAGYSAIKFSIFGGPGTEAKRARVIINGVSTTAFQILLKEGAWSTFEIPLSNFNNPATLSSIEIKEYSGAIVTVYLDDIGIS